MSRLTIYSEEGPARPEFSTEDAGLITERLAEVGVAFERWDSPVAIAVGASAEAILAAYRPHLDRLMGHTGAGSADVVTFTADDPRGASMRKSFQQEHRHSEAEVRFFVRGAGNFILHVEPHVLDVRCEQGDLIAVPAGIKHWFDPGDRPEFTALRVFKDVEGWVAEYTGDRIGERFTAS